MPIDKVPRFKAIHCRHPSHGKKGKVIRRFDRRKFKGGHVPQNVILDAIRRHYKRNHPKAFKRIIAKGVKTRRMKK
jgi:hypothetical protein